MLKKLLLFIQGLIFMNCALMAQSDLSISESSYNISGQILDASNNEAIEFATVSVLDSESMKLISGSNTDLEGKFIVSSNSTNIYLEISFIGYETKRFDNITFKGSESNLGIIRLSSSSYKMDEVIVTAEQSTTEFKLDKRVFNVGKDLSSTGASALEVLNNVPSVNVSLEGEVSLRGSRGVQILINGKPSVLADDQSNALGTITADMIDLSTNGRVA